MHDSHAWVSHCFRRQIVLGIRIPFDDFGHQFADDDFCVFAHVSAESAHARVLDKLGVTPLLDLGMRLGEGSGAALGMVLAKTALHLHMQMATFESAGVSGKD